MGMSVEQERAGAPAERSLCGASWPLERSEILSGGQRMPLKCLKRESDGCLRVFQKYDSDCCKENGQPNNYNIVADW